MAGADGTRHTNVEMMSHTCIEGAGEFGRLNFKPTSYEPGDWGLLNFEGTPYIDEPGEWGLLNFKQTPYIDGQSGEVYLMFTMTQAQAGYQFLASASMKPGYGTPQLWGVLVRQPAGKWGVRNFAETPYVSDQNGEVYQMFTMTQARRSPATCSTEPTWHCTRS